MNQPTIEYKKKVWQFLDEMKHGEAVVIAQKTKPETREDFITAVKEYMDCRVWHGNITFNRDYSVVYKMHPVPETIKNKK